MGLNPCVFFSQSFDPCGSGVIRSLVMKSVGYLRCRGGGVETPLGHWPPLPSPWSQAVTLWGGGGGGEGQCLGRRVVVDSEPGSLPDPWLSLFSNTRACVCVCVSKDPVALALTWVNVALVVLSEEGLRVLLPCLMRKAVFGFSCHV